MEKDYEITFILSNQEKIYGKSLEKIKAIFSDLGVIEKEFLDSGVKKFYFPIKKNLNGRYVTFYLKNRPEVIDKLSKRLNLEETIYRFLIISLDSKELNYLQRSRNKRKKNRLDPLKVI